MHVFITGGTGFVGKAIVLRLMRDGHTVSVWTRRPDEAPALVGGDPELADANAGLDALRRELERADAVINLAGENVVSRWSDSRKQKLRSSRVDLTRELVEAMGRCAKPPEVLLSASAVGYYGSDFERTFDETSKPADDFLARLCVDWEAAAFSARDHGTRVCVFRIGIVLGDGGGALDQMLPIFRAGLGGRLGSGRQWVSWVHLEDLAQMFAAALTDSRFDGAVNAVAPTPITNRTLTQALGTAVNRPTLVPVPAFALRLVFGEGARALLASQKVEPARLNGVGFAFRFDTIAKALADITYRDPSVTIRRAENPPDHPYLQKRGARYVLEQKTVIDERLPDVMPFFSEAANLGALTPPDMDFRILTARPIDMREGQVIDYRITLGPMPMRWRTVIERWSESGFVDAQHKGPYRSWFHEHEFKADGDRTIMTDRVWYSPPFGPLGWIAHAVFIRSMLCRIFEYRSTRVRLRFGAHEERHTKAA